MPPTPAIFPLIESPDLPALRSLLETDSALVDLRHPDPKLHHLTPLQFAAKVGNLEACRLLVEKNAEVYTNPMNTYPPVIHAAWNNHPNVVKYFLEEIPDRAAGTNNLGVNLNLAAREGWTDLVAKHIALDPLAVHQRGWIGDTPLHWPSHNNFPHIVTMLLDAGAAIDADEIRWIGGKPLHWASEHAPDSVRVLLARGANVNSRNTRPDSKFFQMTPLIWNATQKDDFAEITEILIQAGADLTAKDAQNKTALTHARDRNLTKIIQVLEHHGAP